jgi:murein DD-endopeptidase MepM/ murein hydrolase activator NlpD
MAQLQQRLQTVLTADTDFRAAFSALGESLSGQGPILGELGEFCIQVFGAEGGLPEGAEDYAAGAAFQTEQDFLNRPAGAAERVAHYLRLEQVPEDWLAPPQAPAPAQVQAEPAAPAVGTVILRADYTGPALPENYTMDQISLGELQTVTPLLGHLRSDYGYRDHPVDGEYKFHNGVDIGGQEGDAIGAFADGTVDYIGKNDTHGLYLQLDHGNGIKSFYAHCSKLCVSKGQLVAAGEKVAEVGSTGVATGPHLHLELKWNGLHLDPAYYVEFLSA